MEGGREGGRKKGRARLAARPSYPGSRQILHTENGRSGGWGGGAVSGGRVVWGMGWGWGGVGVEWEQLIQPQVAPQQNTTGRRNRVPEHYKTKVTKPTPSPKQTSSLLFSPLRSASRSKNKKVQDMALIITMPCTVCHLS